MPKLQYTLRHMFGDAVKKRLFSYLEVIYRGRKGFRRRGLEISYSLLAMSS